MPCCDATSLPGHSVRLHSRVGRIELLGQRKWYRDHSRTRYSSLMQPLTSGRSRRYSFTVAKLDRPWRDVALSRR
jgi:hypothetical protein